MHIRAMGERDLEAMEAIRAASPEAGQWGLSAYRMLLAEPAKGRVLVAKQEDRVVGFLCYRVTGQEAEVLNLAVLPECRRQGVGSGLLKQAIEEVSEGGARRVFLEVRQSNGPAIRLYERFGFSAVGLRPGYYKDPLDDGVVLARDLQTGAPIES